MYSVNGSDGKLEFKVGINDFPDKLLNDQKTFFSKGIFNWIKQ